ncbi:pectinesterase inhibitor-like [Rhododendron vialii]|uniref:pectinesterase inhibitor-like n=1 Tax=Rhododendron vialii TaxID=182163 RepID=UPI00265DC14A|nr:pectinesterase inhibitor-like [Rhododendron vialii]
MDFSCSKSSSLMVSLLLVLLLNGSSSQPSDLVRTICPRTINNILCLQIFKSDPHSETADVKGLARIAIDAGEASANQTLNTLGSLFNSTPASSLKDVYQTCVRNYETAISKLETAKNLLSSPNYKSASGLSTDATTNISSCDTSFILLPEPYGSAVLSFLDLTRKSSNLARIIEIILVDFLV